MYPLFKSWFLSVDKKGNEGFHRLFGTFSNLVAEVYMYFYRFLLQPIIWFNLYFQWEDTLTSKLHAQIYRFLEDNACKFVKIRDAKKCRNTSYLKHKDASRLKRCKNYVIFQCDFKWKFDKFYKYSTQNKSKIFCKNIAIMYSKIYGYYSSLRLWGLIWKNQSGKLLQVVIFTLANHLEIDSTTRLLLDCLLSCGDITE